MKEFIKNEESTKNIIRYGFALLVSSVVFSVVLILIAENFTWSMIWMAIVIFQIVAIVAAMFGIPIEKLLLKKGKTKEEHKSCRMFDYKSNMSFIASGLALLVVATVTTVIMTLLIEEYTWQDMWWQIVQWEITFLLVEITYIPIEKYLKNNRKEKDAKRT